MKYVRASEALSLGMIWFVLLGAFGPAVLQSTHRDDSVLSERLHAQVRGLQLYTEDWDAIMPVCYRSDFPLQVLFNATIEVPPGWRRDTSAERKAQYFTRYPNSVAPYFRSLADLEIPGAPLIDFGSYRLEDSIADPLPVGFAFNGLLNSYPKASITSPNLVPMVWTGLGRANSRGLAENSPMLMCIQARPINECRFDPKDMTMSGSLLMLRGESKVSDGGIYFGLADGSVKVVPVNTNNEPDSADPWKYENGRAWAYASDGRYPPIFRPDREK